ncbi:MAG TPA: amylovoran biosynthesis protein AmsD [Parvularcula sp.]|nr:amylovoran biosynthesis protein AmsD [Parvularcula sp.]
MQRMRQRGVSNEFWFGHGRRRAGEYRPVRKRPAGLGAGARMTAMPVAAIEPAGDLWPLAYPRQTKVLMVLSALGAGGAERVATALGNYWVGHGADVTIASFEAADAPTYFPLDPGVKVKRLGDGAARQPFLQAVGRTLSRIKALSALIRAERPCVVVSFLTKINIISLLAAPPETPVIISERNNPDRQHFNLLWRMARGAVFPRAAAMVAMTQGAIDAYPAREAPNAVVIPNPVVIPASLSRRSDGRMLTAVGRLARQKRFDLLIESFGRMARDHPGWRLTIWGEGDERKSLEALRDRLGLKDKVLMPGVSADPASWLETADAFVLSSDFEGWGNVIAEAMAAGLPVVATDCDFGPRDMIEHEVSGLLVPVGDPAAFDAALSRLLTDELLRIRLGAAARSRAAAFSLPVLARRWEELIAAAMIARRGQAG